MAISCIAVHDDDDVWCMQFHWLFAVAHVCMCACVRACMRVYVLAMQEATVIHHVTTHALHYIVA